MNRLPLFVGCLGLLCGCAGSSSYRTVVQIVLASAPGEYYVWARVTEQRVTWYSSSFRSLSSPVMTCAAGRPAKAEVSTDGGQSGIFIEAYVAPVGDEKPTTCTFQLKRGGKVLTSTELRLPPIASRAAEGSASIVDQPPIPMPQQVIRATVKAVDMNIKVVVLNVGFETKPEPVKIGYRFWIVRGRDFVAKVKVVSVEKDMCAAEIMLPGGLAVQVGDEARTEF